MKEYADDTITSSNVLKGNNYTALQIRDTDNNVVYDAKPVLVNISNNSESFDYVMAINEKYYVVTADKFNEYNE